MLCKIASSQNLMILRANNQFNTHQLWKNDCRVSRFKSNNVKTL